jgi:hypothetical protein
LSGSSSRLQGWCGVVRNLIAEIMELLQQHQHQQLDACPKMRHHHHPLITPTSPAYDQASRAVITMTFLCRSLSHSGKYRKFQSKIPVCN